MHMLIGGKKDNELVSGTRVGEFKRYLNRLALARKKCERKIKELGGSYHAVRSGCGVCGVAYF